MQIANKKGNRDEQRRTREMVRIISERIAYGFKVIRHLNQKSSVGDTSQRTQRRRFLILLRSLRGAKRNEKNRSAAFERAR